MATYDLDTADPRFVPEFDYSVWTPDTRVSLLAVPWDSSYRDIVRFEDETTRDSWFASRTANTVWLDGLHYLKYGEPVMVPLPFSQCNQMNYLVAENPIQPVPSRSAGVPRKPDKFFYFINDVRYIAPNTTALEVQLDVWTTYFARIEFGRSYIVRGHIAHANANATLETLSSYLTEAEGIEYGDEYEVAHQEFMNLSGTAAAPPWVLIVSNTKLDGTYGTVDKPQLRTADGAEYNGMMGGCQAWAVSLDQYNTLMSILSDAPWVAQGIVYMTILPREMVNVNTGNAVHPNGNSAVDMYLLGKNARYSTLVNTPDFFANFGLDSDFSEYLKLYTYPYCLLEVTSLQGNPVVYKPECFAVANDTITWRRQYSVCPPDQRIVMWPTGYNSAAGSDVVTTQSVNGAGSSISATINSGEALDMAVSLTNFPQMSTVNNMYTSYLASTANTRKFQQGNASWAQQKSLAAAGNALNLADVSMSTQQLNQDIANQLTLRNAQISQEQNTWSGIKGIAGGAASGIGAIAQGDAAGVLGGAASAATSYLDMAANADWIARSTSAQLSAANQTTRSNLAYQRQVADTNYSYANFAANGDYQQAIQGIQATVRDAALTQPTVSGQLGGDTFNWSNGYVGFLLKWKHIKPQYVRQVGQYFQRYGYYVNRFLVPPQNLKCMTRFTYWQMRECYVLGNLPEVFRQAIRGIFESGVTVWAAPEYIGRTDFSDNDKVGGVSY